MGNPVGGSDGSEVGLDAGAEVGATGSAKFRMLAALSLLKWSVGSSEALKLAGPEGARQLAMLPPLKLANLCRR